MRAIRKYFQKYWKYKIQQTKEELNTMKIGNDIYYVGVNDHQVDLFEGQYVVPNGMSYNSYVILDEKIAVMDTVDANFTHEWLDNIQKVLGDRKPDYLIVQHMEPDHAANIANFLKAYPDTIVVSNKKAFAMMQNFFDLDLEGHQIIVDNGGTLSLGKHDLTFVFAPMVHWPEVMVTYDSTDKVLFSADGFGKFGALDVEEDWDCEARRYYIGIVGKYGPQVQKLLKAAATLDIQTICPLHGPVWRNNLNYFIEKHDKWSKYEPEDQAVAIIYGSIYGNTEQAADALAAKLGAKGVKNIAVYDASKTDVSELIAEIFRVSHVVIACPTYNGGIYPPIENLLAHMKALAVQNRTVAVMDNGTWAATAGKQIVKQLEEMKNMTVLDQKLSIKSTLKADQEDNLDAFAQQIIDAM